ncbi:MAG: class I SAM-dependent methyltransferase [Candidatus Eisenbacteria bacterium]|nr:class I SAM-dependent methyltransferase [Candidatus Eisenbacteria bacterium]
MDPEFRNVYDDDRRAAAYSELEFPGTYYLAFRDLPALFSTYVSGGRALDFGCGTGRSTRFLRDLGFSVVGVDISAPMLARARALDPDGEYYQVGQSDLAAVPERSFDLVLSAFTFDNMPTLQQRERALGLLRGLLADRGCIVSIVSSPEIYVNEWASFSTRDYPENTKALSGDRVSIVMLDVADRRPVEDVLCSHDDYERMYDRTGLTVLEVLRPLATGEEPIQWRSETETAPWVIYVLRP